MARVEVSPLDLSFISFLPSYSFYWVSVLPEAHAYVLHPSISVYCHKLKVKKVLSLAGLLTSGLNVALTIYSPRGN